MRYLAVILGTVMVGCSMAQVSRGANQVARRLPVPQVSSEPTNGIANPFEGTNSPIIAVWQDSPGHTAQRDYPYLRVAVWADGRVVFARDPTVWNHDLLIGQLSAQALTTLQRDIRQTGVFDLTATSHLVPDAPIDCIMLSFGGSRQMLYWDEVEGDYYGINISPNPQGSAFKKAWWEVNRLVLVALPHEAKRLETRFPRPPKEWHLEKRIQSK